MSLVCWERERERVPILSPHAVSSPSVDITIRIEDGDDAPFQLINKTSDCCILICFLRGREKVRRLRERGGGERVVQFHSGSRVRWQSKRWSWD